MLTMFNSLQASFDLSTPPLDLYRNRMIFEVNPQTKFEIVSKDLYCCSETFRNPTQLNTHYREIHHKNLPTSDPACWPNVIIRDHKRHKEAGVSTWKQYIPFPRPSRDLTWTITAPSRTAGTREERKERRKRAKRTDLIYKQQYQELKERYEQRNHLQRTEDQDSTSLQQELNAAYHIASEHRQSTETLAHVTKELSHVKRLLKASVEAVNELQAEKADLEDQLESLHAQR